MSILKTQMIGRKRLCMGEKPVQLTIKVTRLQREQWKARAKAAGISLSEMIRSRINHYDEEEI